MAKLFIVGGGLGRESLLTAEAREVISRADRILSTAKFDWSVLSARGGRESRRGVRDAQEARNGPRSDDVRVCTLPELMTVLEEGASGNTVVIVSGDGGFFSVSETLIRTFADRYETERITGVSSVQYFSAKIAVSYNDARMISMHGRDGRIVPGVSYHKKVFALTGGRYKAHDVCRLLSERGLGYVRVQIGENLSRAEETITSGTAEELQNRVFDNLSVMYIENETAQNPSEPLCDEDFIRGESPMTKEEVRWISLQKLKILPDDIVYDIGAGTGSVSVESARKAFNGYVYAIEAKKEACALLMQNREKHGAYNMMIVDAKAPDAFTGLPSPDKVFVGGSAGNMDAIISGLVKMNPKVRIVANAVTLQSIGQILSSFFRCGLETDTICLNVARARKRGAYDMMTAQNPVYIVTGFKREEVAR